MGCACITNVCIEPARTVCVWRVCVLVVCIKREGKCGICRISDRKETWRQKSGEAVCVCVEVCVCGELCGELGTTETSVCVCVVCMSWHERVCVAGKPLTPWCTTM